MCRCRVTRTSHTRSLSARWTVPPSGTWRQRCWFLGASFLWGCLGTLCLRGEDERKFFLGMHRGWYSVFLCAAQGTRNGLSAWAGVISLVMRLSQSVSWESGKCRIRSNTCADDPLIAFRGNQYHVQHSAASLILLWLCLEFLFAYGKGALGSSVVWIGPRISLLFFDPLTWRSVRNVLASSVVSPSKPREATCGQKKAASFFSWKNAQRSRLSSVFGAVGRGACVARRFRCTAELYLATPNCASVVMDPEPSGQIPWSMLRRFWLDTFVGCPRQWR